MNGTPEELRALFERHDSFLLTAHVSPDGDALGSLAALSLWLKGKGKKVITVIDDSIDDKFFFIEECQHILRPSDVELKRDESELFSMRRIRVEPVRRRNSWGTIPSILTTTYPMLILPTANIFLQTVPQREKS